MSYCTLDDLIVRYGEEELIRLTDKNDLGQLDIDVINSALADTDSIIDGYLASRYAAPVSPVPTSLARVACNIARYYLYEDMATDQVEKRYEESIAFLKGIAKGDISIGITAAGETPTSHNTVKIETGGNVFNRKDKSFI